MSRFYGNVIAAIGDSSTEAGRVLQQMVVSDINTVGNGVLPAGSMAGGIIIRGGTQTAIFTDTTDTAVNIINALFGEYMNSGKISIGSACILRIVNTTGDAETIAPGTGVTINGTASIAAASSREFLLTVLSSTTVSLTNIGGGSD